MYIAAVALSCAILILCPSVTGLACRGGSSISSSVTISSPSSASSSSPTSASSSTTPNTTSLGTTDLVSTSNGTTSVSSDDLTRSTVLSNSVSSVPVANYTLSTSLGVLASPLTFGTYIIASTSTSLYLGYNTSFSVVPNNLQPTKWAIGQVNQDDQDGKVNGTEELLTSDGKRSISAGNDKCVSAQWGFDIGADHAAVAYGCGGATLRHAKTLWLFIPSSTNTTSTPPTSNATFAGTFSIVAVDHILDQYPRAISAEDSIMRMNYSETVVGAPMVPWQDGEGSLLWQVWRTA